MYSRIGTFEPIEILYTRLQIHLTDVDVSLRNNPGKSSPQTASSGKQFRGNSPNHQNDDIRSKKSSQTWLSTSIYSRFVRHAVNLSIFVKNLLLKYKCSGSLVLSCRIDSLSFVNIPEEEWTGFVTDPNAWLSKGLLIQGMRISLERDRVVTLQSTINSLQLSCLLPLSSLLGDEEGSDDNQKIPAFAEISSVDLEIVDDVLEDFQDFWHAFYGVSYPASPSAYRKHEVKNWDWIQRELKLEGNIWSLDIGLTIGRCKVVFMSDRSQDDVSYAMDILLDHLILHLESENGTSKLFFAIESWSLYASGSDSLSWNTVFKGLPVEDGADVSKHAIEATAFVSKEQKSYFKIILGETFLNISRDDIDILKRWAVQLRRFIVLQQQKTEHNTLGEFAITAHSVDVGMSYKCSRLSFWLTQIEIRRCVYEAKLALGVHVGLQGSPLTIADGRKSLSNQIRVRGRMAENFIELIVSPINIFSSGLDLLAGWISCCFGRFGENLIDWENLATTPFSISWEIGEIQSSFNLIDRTFNLRTDLNLCVRVGNLSVYASINGMFLSLSSGISIDMSTIRGVVRQSGHSTPFLQVSLSGALVSQSEGQQKVHLPNICVDVEIQRLDLEPLVQFLYCPPPENISTSNNAELYRKSCPIEIEVETISLTTRLEDRRWAFWLSGLRFVQCRRNIESLVVFDFGAEIESSNWQDTGFLCFQR